VVDRYTIEARLWPALIVLFPIPCVILAWFPNAHMVSASGLISYAAVSALLAQLARDLGKERERGLYLKWGGKPTTQLLRHRTSKLEPSTLERYHTKLARLVGIRMPSADEEKHDSNAADNAYESGVRWLREATRDKRKFTLIFSENVNYGFRRNLWAMKPAGTLLSTGGAVACGVAIATNHVGGESSLLMPMMGLAANVILLVWWVIRIKPSWVKITADAYAERILAACDVI